MAGRELPDFDELMRSKVEGDGMEYFVATDMDEWTNQPELRPIVARWFIPVESNAFYHVWRVREGGPADTAPTN